MADNVKMVTVTCPNHHRELTNGLWNLLQSGYGLDYDLKRGERSVGAHGVVLLAFLSTTEKSPLVPVQQFSDREPSDNDDLLQLVLEFVYKGSVTLSLGQLDDLQATARQLDFRLLVDAVEETKQHEPVELIIPSVDEMSSEMSSEIPSFPDREADARREQATGELNLTSLAGEHLARSGRLARLPCHPTIECDPGVLIFRCSKCRVKFWTEAAMQHHCDFEICFGQSNSTSELWKAIGFKCKFCRKKFRLEESLVKHTANHPKYKCTLCPFESRYNCSLIEHRKTIHRVDAKGNDLSNMKCSECDYSATSTARLRRHRQRRHPHSKVHPQKQKKTIMCKFCRKAFDSAKSRDEHVINHRTYYCGTCYFVTKYHRSLIAHQKRVHHVDASGNPVSEVKEVPPKQPIPREMPNAAAFKCAFCTRLFLSEEHCAEHMAGHLKYKCTLCRFESPYNASLFNHLKFVHHVDGRGNPCSNFKCPDCSYSTWNNENLKVHRRRRHNDPKQGDQHMRMIYPDGRPPPWPACRPSATEYASPWAATGHRLK